MCGIIGYIGQKNDPLIGVRALQRLEYRGYDSWGAVVYNDKQKKFFCFKKTGKIKDSLNEFRKQKLRGNVFLFHCRWATHGKVTELNAHPHFDCQKKIFLVHNGIIENYQKLKEQLIKEGHHFRSETDTEVIVHLIEKFFKGNLEEAVRRTLPLLQGTYGLAVVAQADPNKIVAARWGSPLLLGLGKKEFIVASDPAAVVERTKKVIYLDDGEIAVLTPHNFFILKEKEPKKIDWHLTDIEKGGYPYFMLKEIMEEPLAIENAIRGRLVLKEGKVKLGGLDIVQERLKRIKRIILVACGSSFYAGCVGKYLLEELAGLPAKTELASEFRYAQPVLDKETAVVFISQSGETADTLTALRETKKQKVLTIGITNVVGSSQSRETEAGVYTRSGPEIAVAATKTFVGQLAVLVLLALYLAQMRKMSLRKNRQILKELSKLSQSAQEVLKEKSFIEKLAKNYKDFSFFYLIGRKYSAPIAYEGALKIKEVACLAAEGLAGGELKHGPLALVNENLLTIAICPLDSVYDKMFSNLQEVKARQGSIIAITNPGDKKIKKIADEIIYLPTTLECLSPLLSVIPLHLFAYYLAVLTGRDPDYCRNLAKSVTVE